MGSAAGAVVDDSHHARAMNLARGKILCPLDQDWNMKESESGTLKKDQAKGRREDDRGETSMLTGIDGVAT